MRKKFRSKKRIVLNKYLFVGVLVGIIIKFSPNYNINLFNNNEKLINKLLNSSNHYMEYKNKSHIFNNILDYLLGIEISNPLSIISKKFDYEKIEDDSDIAFMVNTNNIVNDKKRIYVYSSHQTEGYNNGEFNVFLASKLLKEKLEKLGISTLVEEGNFTEFMRVNNYTHAYSYITSRYFIEEVIRKNDFDLIIDLHRDSNNKQSSTVNIGGEDYAKILFVVGLENKNYQNNLDVTNKINNMFLERYPNLSRGVYKKEGPGVDGVYNQDLNEKMILLEVGGYQNTKEEVANTLNAVSEIIKQYLEKLWKKKIL